MSAKITVGPYRKLIVAVAAGVVVCGAVLARGTVDYPGVVQMVVSVLGALGVYHVPNDPIPDPPGASG